MKWMVEIYGDHSGIKPRWTVIGMKNEKSPLKYLLVFRPKSGEGLAADVRQDGLQSQTHQHPGGRRVLLAWCRREGFARVLEDNIAMGDLKGKAEL